MNARTLVPRYRLVQLTGASASRDEISARHQVAFSEFVEPGHVAAKFFDGRQIHDLGTLGGAVSVAHGLNNRGQVVGHSLLPDASTHGFLWTPDEGMLDLNTLVTNAPAGLVLVLGRQILDDGAILAEALGGGLYLLLEGRGRDEAPVVAPIVVTGILDVGQPLCFRANFTDVDRYQSHRAAWEWGDGLEDRGAVAEDRGVGSASGAHGYAEAGLYTVVLTLRDSGGERTVIRRTIGVGVPAPLAPGESALPRDTGEGGLPGLRIAR